VLAIATSYIGMPDHLGLKGFARNLPDGTVQVVVEGKESAINELHKTLKKGPTFSRG
jgi:acylphosphatase